MALQTSGFQVPANIRAPQIPSNIGNVDVKGIYDSVTEGLKSYETMRQLPAQQAADSSRLALATQKAGAEQSLIAPETEARRGAAARAAMFSTPQMLQGEQMAVQAQRDSILRTKAREEVELSREQGLVQTAAAEEPLARAEILDALKLADYEAQALALSEIRTKYPWMDLPQYKSISGVLDARYKTALDQVNRDAKLDDAITLEGVKGTKAIETANARTDLTMRLLNEYSSLEEQLKQNPSDQSIRKKLDRVDQQLNKTAATEPLAPKTTSVDEVINSIIGLRTAARKARADGDIQLAEDLENRLKRDTLPRTTGTDMGGRTAAMLALLGGTPNTPVAQAPVAAPKAPAVRVVTRGQYDALPSGTDYIDSQGGLFTKP
jgi:molybdenum-dependent DNA-binding transcriptional regulator ModE